MEDRTRRLGEWALTCALSLGLLETANPCVNVIAAGMHPLHPDYPLSPFVGVSELFTACFIFMLGSVSIFLEPRRRPRANPAQVTLDGREPGADGTDTEMAGTSTRRPGESREDL